MICCSGIDREALPDLDHVRQLLPQLLRQAQGLVIALIFVAAAAEAENELIPEVVVFDALHRILEKGTFGVSHEFY